MTEPKWSATLDEGLWWIENKVEEDLSVHQLFALHRHDWQNDAAYQEDAEDVRDLLNALEERISDLEARAALCDTMIERVKAEAYDKAWPYGCELDWLARYDALPSTTKETQ